MSEEDKGVKYRVEKFDMYMLVGAAAVVDLLAAIIAAIGAFGTVAGGWGVVLTVVEFFLANVIGFFGFWLIFWMKDVKFFNPKTVKKKAVMWLAEWIPYADILFPGITIAIWMTCRDSREEDEEKHNARITAENIKRGEDPNKGRVKERVFSRQRRRQLVRLGERSFENRQRRTKRPPSERVYGQKAVGDNVTRTYNEGKNV